MRKANGLILAQNTPKEQGIALVGVGYWGPNLIRNFLETPQCRMLTCCDTDPARREFIRKRFPGIPVTSNIEEVLRDPRIDGVVLATPIRSHYALARAALLAGKHVLVEKPLTDSLREAKNLQVLAKKQKRILMVNHTFLYSPPVLKIQEIIRSGSLGSIHFINMVRVNFGIHRSPSNVLWDLGAHDISILLHWMNEMPIEVQAFGRDCVEKGILDVGYINLRFQSGPVANINVSWLAPNKFRKIVLVGANQMIVYDDTLAEEKIKLYHQGVAFKPPHGFGEYQLTYRTGDIVSPHIEAREPLNEVAKQFIRSLSTGSPPPSDGENGVRVVKILHHAILSLKHNSRWETVT